ncbi:MAG TPA: M20/M25/M40 family metallo-hydrolase [Anaerolineales bacterium]|jgi:endoglucanase|nr:M20/M25/M40 family metallo-hydrolase [Anaerolineales bacterium]
MPSSEPNATRITEGQIRLLRSLTETTGVSGGEGAVRRLVRAEVETHVDDLWTDALGNLLAVRRGRGRGRLKVMLAAHMDEVGFMITEADTDGFLAFEAVGRIDRDGIAGKSLWIGDDRHLGVIGIKPIHLTDERERSRRLTIDSLRIDIGADGREAALERVRPGDRASFATEFRRMRGTLFGKALDDRLGVASLIELLRHVPDSVDLMAAFTVQEEIGQIGARVAAQALDPDLAVVLDCTPARDLPVWDGSENRTYNARLGAGPAIYAADKATVSDPRLFALFTETAARMGRPYQIRQPGGGKTDAAAIHLANGGVPCISISVPARYLHGPAGMARIADWRGSVSLVHQVLSSIRPAMLKRH